MKTPRRYFIQHIVVNVIINFALVFFLSGFALAELERVPLWPNSDAPTETNMSGEMILESFILGFILTLVLTIITRHKLRNREVNTAGFTPHSWISLYPEQLFKRSLYLGLTSLLLVGIPVVLLLSLLDIQHIDAQIYRWWHAFYISLLSGLITYVACNRALANPRH